MKPQTIEKLSKIKSGKLTKFYKEIPSYAYNPQPKPPSRRDLIRAGIINRKGEAK